MDRIALLKKFASGKYTKQDAINELLESYGDQERYFLHRGFYKVRDGEKQTSDKWVTTEDLIEISKDFFENELMILEESIKKQTGKEWHRPVKFKSNEIPESKTVIQLLL